MIRVEEGSFRVHVAERTNAASRYEPHPFRQGSLVTCAAKVVTVSVAVPIIDLTARQAWKNQRRFINGAFKLPVFSRGQ